MKSGVLGIVLLLLLASSAFAMKDEKLTAKDRASIKLTMKQAEQKALTTQPGKVTERELEKEGGKVIYSFDIKAADGQTHEVNIDAVSGAVLQNQIESAAAEAKEKREGKSSAKERKR